MYLFYLCIFDKIKLILFRLRTVLERPKNVKDIFIHYISNNIDIAGIYYCIQGKIEIKLSKLSVLELQSYLHFFFVIQIPFLWII